MKIPKSVSRNISPFIEKNQNLTPIKQKIENPSKTHTFYVDLHSKDPIIIIMGQGGGYKL